MIRLHIPGFYNSDSGGPRWGDATIITDDKGNADVIDGYCGIGATRLISILKKRNIKKPYLHISHAHYDHYYGIRRIIADSWFAPRALYCYDPNTLGDVSGDVRSEKITLKAIISEAKARKIPVVYLKNGDDICHGDIHFKVYRNQPSYKGNSDAYLNDGSLCFWFPELSYLTTGDAGLWCAERYKLPVKFFKGGHHDNDNSGDTMKPSEMCRWLKNRGCEYFWDNDYSTKLTDFLMTGREDALNAKMKFFDIHGDINAIFWMGKAVIYKHGQIYRYTCGYNGAPALVNPDLENVKMVLSGKAGTDDARTTYLLNHRMNPGLIQKEVNELYKLIKG